MSKPRFATLWAFLLILPVAALAQENESEDYLDAVTANVPEEVKEEIPTETVRLKYAEAERAMLVVRQALGIGDGDRGDSSGPINIAVDPRTDTLIMRGPASAVKEVQHVLEEIDRPADANEELSVKIFNLRNTEAEPTMEVLRDALGVGRPDGLAGPVHMAADAATNSVIMRGPKSVLEVAEAVLLRLDGEKGSAQPSVHLEVVLCELNGDPTEVLKDFAGVRNFRIPSSAPIEVVFDELIPTLVEAGVVGKPIRLAGTTLEGGLGQIHDSADKPLVIGVSFSNHGRNNTVQYRTVGTLVNFLPKRAGNGVNIELKVEHSRLGPAERGTIVSEPAEGQQIRTPAIISTSYQGTLHIGRNQAVVFGVVRSGDDSVDNGLLVAVRAVVE